MKRAGFTMIELIFVIVILGILAAVALPKFAGVSDQANAQKCNAFVGTMNRTIGPSMWSQSITDGDNGSIQGYTTTNFIVDEDIPVECLAAAGTAFSGTLNTALVPTQDAVDSLFTPTFGTSTYELNVTDGNISDAPRWTWEKTN
ncbi:MAG: type II secretion system protein [Helicobacteraceae bacterium]|jgi:prepilin-type N-terminal cleavage/methylation domain-containing protein|nr:type II secretion system protein [Helicobacteraceae bacterium]